MFKGVPLRQRGWVGDSTSCSSLFVQWSQRDIQSVLSSRGWTSTDWRNSLNATEKNKRPKKAKITILSWREYLPLLHHLHQQRQGEKTHNNTNTVIKSGLNQNKQFTQNCRSLPASGSVIQILTKQVYKQIKPYSYNEK